MPAVISSPKALRWVPGDDSASALIRYTGPWSMAESGQEGSSNKRSESGTNANQGSSTRWIDSNGSLSVDFAGYDAALVGGMSFTPTAGFAFCTVDGVTVPLASAFTPNDATRAQKSEAGNTVPLCHVTGLVDGPHVLTFNITNIGSGPAGALAGASNDDSRNRLWIEGLSYATSRWHLAARQAPTSSASSVPSGSVSSTGPVSPSATSTAAGNSTTGHSNNNDSGTSSKTAARIGEIAGGIIGGALLVVFLRGVFFFVQRNDGTRTAVGRPPSPTYESGWTLPKFGKSGGGGGGGGGKKGLSEVSGEEAKHAHKIETAVDVPLSPMKEDDGKVSTVTPAEHAMEGPETGARIQAV